MITVYWRLNGNANSAVGSYNGTDYSVSYKPGIINSAADYSGTGSYTTIPNAPISFTGTGSFSFWLKIPDTVSQHKFIIDFGDLSNSYDYSYLHYYASPYNIKIFMIPKDWTNYAIGNIGSVVGYEGKWVYVAFTWTSGYNMKSYLNSKLITDGTGANQNPDNTIIKFGRATIYTQPMGGFLCDVKIRNNTLSPGENKNEYAKVKGFF